jgi:hypothetical protein
VKKRTEKTSIRKNIDQKTIMQYFYANLAVLSTTTIACMNNGQLEDFHNQVQKEVHNSLLNLREQSDATMERLGEWHEVKLESFDDDHAERKAEMDEFMESNKPNFSDFPSLNQEKTHDSLSESENDSSDTDSNMNSSFHNDSFFKHPLSNLNSLIGSFFNHMGAFFGGSSIGPELVEEITTANGTDYEKTSQNMTNDEGRVVGKRTTYNFDSGKENTGENDSEFYQVQSVISFSDIANVQDFVENEDYYNDGTEESEDKQVEIKKSEKSKIVKSESKSELESLKEQNEKSSYRKPDFKDSEKNSVHIEMKPVDVVSTEN